MYRCILGKEEVRAVKRKVSVNLIGRNLMIAGDAVFVTSIEKNLCSEYVCLEENLRIFY